MNRRRFLATACGVSAVGIGGCVEHAPAAGSDLELDPESDPFPMTINVGSPPTTEQDDETQPAGILVTTLHRGGVDDLFRRTVDTVDGSFPDASQACIEPFDLDELIEEIQDQSPVDRLQINARSSFTFDDDTDGDILVVSPETAEHEYHENAVVKSTPPTAMLETTTGAVLCRIPIYVGSE